jgi:hypothetical protein
MKRIFMRGFMLLMASYVSFPFFLGMRESRIMRSILPCFIERVYGFLTVCGLKNAVSMMDKDIL